MTHTVGIFLFDQVEALDFAGPYEVFTTASRVHRRLQSDAPAPFDVVTLVAGARRIRARAGMRVEADYHLDSHPPLDLVIVPGGDISGVAKHPGIIGWLRSVAPQASVMASVCTGAFLLAEAGLLDHRAATTHWEDLADLQALYPKVLVRPGRRWIDEGKLVTSAGISAGIDMSLHLVGRLAGIDLAVKTARQMEFDWTPA